MRQIINLPPALKDLVSKASKVWHYPESCIIAYCISSTFQYFADINYDDFCNKLETYYRYHIKALPRDKKSKEINKCQF